jgi:FAD/FMN-containing dehydrogenase
MATTMSSAASSISAAEIDALSAGLSTPLVKPEDPGYEEARKVYNAMIDRRPAFIAQCSTVADVVAAVNFAREHGVLLAIRGGGHNGPGLGTCDDGLVIDLSPMHSVQVDPTTQTVRVGGGATWGQVDQATHEHGMATPSGIISTTGVGGLTLGGGVGNLTRRSGLAIDHLLEAEMVLADGSCVTASETANPDLFWAIRGGGGNFGVVTSFLFRLDPIDMVYGGPMLWHLDKATEVLTWYRDYMPNAPDDVNGWFAFLTIPPADPFPAELHGKSVCGVVWTITSPQAEAEATLAPIREMFGGPALDWVGMLPHPAIQGMFDPFYPKGEQWYWKADFFNELSDAAIAEHVKFGSSMPTGKSTMHLYPIDGAASRVPNDATAWNFRDAKWAQVMVGVSPDPADNERMIKWTQEYWNALHPHSAGGAYVNMMMDAADEGADRVRASYGSNYDRLAAIKAKYDPGNLFRVNQNIAPRS